MNNYAITCRGKIMGIITIAKKLIDQGKMVYIYYSEMLYDYNNSNLSYAACSEAL